MRTRSLLLVKTNSQQFQRPDLKNLLSHEGYKVCDIPWEMGTVLFLHLILPSIQLFTVFYILFLLPFFIFGSRFQWLMSLRVWSNSPFNSLCWYQQTSLFKEDYKLGGCQSTTVLSHQLSRMAPGKGLRAEALLSFSSLANIGLKARAFSAVVPTPGSSLFGLRALTAPSAAAELC